MKIAILGTRGVPNRYGGFEQFAQYLSLGLAWLGADVWVYNSHDHPHKEKKWQGVNIIHRFDPERYIGASGQFIYDLNCILHSRRRDFDIILQLGYTTSTIWHWLLPRKSLIVTNMDGLEWKRSKYGKLLQRFLRHAERWAVKSSHRLIADSEAIQQYLEKTYGVTAQFIPYGSQIFNSPNPESIKPYGVEPFKYFLMIARMQPDNHVEEVIKGVLESGSDFPLLIVGNTENGHGCYLTKRYSNANIRFIGPLFDEDALNQLRYHCACYFHGHSAGGTNPSLLEAMAASALICAHRNPFNQSVLRDNALFFANEHEIADAVKDDLFGERREKFISANLKRIETDYRWDDVINSYYHCFQTLLRKSINVIPIPIHRDGSET
ncbi:MAG TPA: DUF1972 domain-containing protein [Tenuifilaceae bacterium]|nr:DUF1972 domain-containing protein [Tenuifilaceae bacterium]